MPVALEGQISSLSPEEIQTRTMKCATRGYPPRENLTNRPRERTVPDHEGSWSWPSGPGISTPVKVTTMTWHPKVQRRWLAVLAGCVVLLPRWGRGAEIDIGLSGDWPVYADRPAVAVNVGDTVKWTLAYGGPVVTESFAGAWRALLLRVGDQFAFTFTNAGVFAYRTRSYGGSSDNRLAATITVLDWTNRPPPITINDPLDGFQFPGNPWFVPIQATLAATNPPPRRVDFFAGATLIGTVTNSPYLLNWTNYPPEGAFTLSARLTDASGATGWSRPVRISFSYAFHLWGPQRQPNGELVLYYSGMNARAPDRSYVIGRDRYAATTSKFFYESDAGYGVLVDLGAAQAPQRFYWMVGGEFPPP